jgi:hypothetical protein
MKKILLAIALSFPLLVSAQDFRKIFFKDSYWFSENKDSSFYKSDTLKFVLYKNTPPKWAAKETVEDERAFLGHGEFVKLRFLRNKRFEFSRHVYHMAAFYIPTMRWDYDEKLEQLKIFKNQILIASYKPIRIEELQLNSRFSGDSVSLKTTMITVLRIK